jgi:UDP-glucose 4-epimerase
MVDKETKKVLITGGAGFIGSNLVEKFLDENYKVIVLDNFSTGKIENLQEHENLEIHEGDICDEVLLEKLIEQVQVIVHLAAMVSIPETIERPEESFKVNVKATRNIFELAVKNEIEKVIFATSAAVYGDNNNLPLKEDEIPNPISPYGEHKLKNENDAMELSNDKTTFIGFRFQNVYGPKQSLKGAYAAVIPIFIDKALSKKTITVFGDGKQIRDFVYVKDVVEIILSSIKSDEIKSDIFNVGRGEPKTLIDLIDSISEILDSKLEVEFQAPRVGDVKESFADIERLKVILNYSPKYGLKQGLFETIKHIKSGN